MWGYFSQKVSSEVLGPYSHQRISVLVTNRTQDPPAQFSFLDLSAFSPFQSISGNWLQDRINSYEGPRTKHAIAFILENINCMPMVWRALSWVLNVNCGLCSPLREPEFPFKTGCACTYTQMPATSHQSENTANM